MFGMFKGGKPDPMTLWVVDQEEQKAKRKRDLDKLVRSVRSAYAELDEDEQLNLWEYANKARLAPLSQEEIDYIIRQVED